MSHFGLGAATIGGGAGAVSTRGAAATVAGAGTGLAGGGLTGCATRGGGGGGGGTNTTFLASGIGGIGADIQSSPNTTLATATSRTQQ